jgi:hypothetical protein
MGIASFSPTGLFGSFQDLVGWLSFSAPKARAVRQPLALRPGPVRGTTCSSHAGAATVRSACTTLNQATPLRPLRVLRVVDGPQTPATAGRMLISGRMADVCAELDRLAALEACPRNGALLQ